MESEKIDNGPEEYAYDRERAWITVAKPKVVKR